MHKQGNDANCNVINEAESTKKINQHCGTFVNQNQIKKKKCFPPKTICHFEKFPLPLTCFSVTS